jgi:hypothetical protein
MQISGLELTSEQIAQWMRLAAAQPRPAVQVAAPGAPMELRSYRDHPGFDFKKAKQALNRARAKTDVNTIKPFRRLRRNQGAVNEGLIDAFSALMAVNKQMAAEIAALSVDLAALRQRLAENETSSASENIGPQL